MVSRVARLRSRNDLMSRVMGASWQADAFIVAFRLPNMFRRLFGEGAFSAGLRAAVTASGCTAQDGEAEAQALLRRSAGGVRADAGPVHRRSSRSSCRLFVSRRSRATDGPNKFGLATFLTRITFPYLILISLVSLFSGILNSLTRFAAAAFAPALLNLAHADALCLRARGRDR